MNGTVNSHYDQIRLLLSLLNKEPCNKLAPKSIGFVLAFGGHAIIQGIFCREEIRLFLFVDAINRIDQFIVK